jgi:hypothetical protein
LGSQNDEPFVGREARLDYLSNYMYYAWRKLTGWVEHSLEVGANIWRQYTPKSA